MMILSREIKSFIKTHAEETFPEECCGLIVRESDEKVSPIKCRNDSPDRLKFFRISPVDYLKAHRKGKVVASYHSHGGEGEDRFSEFDKQSSINLNLNYILYSVAKDCFLEYDPRIQHNEYVGKVFFWGKNDCFSLVRSFYKQEFGITIPDPLPERAKDENIRFLNSYGKLIEDGYEENGWEKVFSFEEIKKYDLLCFDYKKTGTTSHLAIYLDNNLILHHPCESYSCVEQVNPKSLKFFRMALRHKDLK